MKFFFEPAGWVQFDNRTLMMMSWIIVFVYDATDYEHNVGCFVELFADSRWTDECNFWLKNAFVSFPAVLGCVQSSEVPCRPKMICFVQKASPSPLSRWVPQSARSSSLYLYMKRGIKQFNYPHKAHPNRQHFHQPDVWFFFWDMFKHVFH
jgi:hypothetical protein